MRWPSTPASSQHLRRGGKPGSTLEGEAQMYALCRWFAVARNGLNAADMSTLYDNIGRTYSGRRQSDPRIASAIEAAVAGCDSVLNVGAGTGSYEPRSQMVVAVEPSRTMISQRPVGAAPVIQGCAEALPFRDRSFYPV